MLRRGVERIRHRGDHRRARALGKWSDRLLGDFEDRVQDVTADIAQRWGRLPVPRPENAIDKQIAATALIYDLTVVTRNHKDFSKTGVRLLNPFEQ